MTNLLLQDEINEIIENLDENIKDVDSRLDLVINSLEKHPKVLDIYINRDETESNHQLSEMFEKLDEYVNSF